jgi:hypothetical protein
MPPEASVPSPARETRPRVALLLTVAFAFFWIALGARVLQHSRRTDFVTLYAGGSFALDWDWQRIYTEAGQLAREQRFVPERSQLWPFLRPPAYAAIIAPLALMPFALAFWFWICVQSAVLLGCWAWAWKRFGPEAAVWGALLYAGPLGIAHGQDCALFLALLCGAFMLGEKKRFLLCGLVLGLGLTRFYLFLLWPLVLAVQRRWRMLAGFAICGLGQGLFSLAVLGWGGLREYTGFVLHMTGYFPPERYLGINAILFNAGISSPLLLIILTALVVGLVLWCSQRTASLWMTFTLATAGSLVIGPHVYGYDATMFLLPAWCVIFLSRFRIAKLSAATICSPIAALASSYGPPLAGFMALALLVFIVGVCVESLLNHDRTETPGDAHFETLARRLAPASEG